MSSVTRLLRSARGHAWHLTTTVCLCLGIVMLGTYYELSGPTLPALKRKVGADYEQISRALVAQSAAILISCFAGGYLADRWRHRVGLILFLAQGLIALTTSTAAWSRALWVLALLYFLQGLGIGPLGVGANAWIMWMWGKHAAAPNYALHWSFGIGAFIAPQLAKSFIPELDEEDTNITPQTAMYSLANNTTSAFPDNITSVITSWDEAASEINIEYAFMICGVLAGVVGISYLLLQCNMDKIETSADVEADYAVAGGADEGLRSIVSPARCSGGSQGYGSVMVALIFLYHFLVVGGERSWGRFLFSYVLERRHELRMDTGEMSDLQSAFWLSFFLGRGLSTLVGHWVNPVLMITTVYILYLADAVLLATLAPNNKTLLWIFSSAFGALVAPLFPGGIVIYREYVHISAMIIALGQAGAAFGGMFFQWMSGYLLEYHRPNSLLFFNIVYIVAVIVVYTLLVLIGTWHRRRLKRDARGGEEELAEKELEDVDLRIEDKCQS